MANYPKYVLVKSVTKLEAIEVETGKSFENYVAIRKYNDIIGKHIIAEDAYYYFEMEQLRYSYFSLTNVC